MILDAPESAGDSEQLKKLVAMGYSLSMAKYEVLSVVRHGPMGVVRDAAWLVCREAFFACEKDLDKATAYLADQAGEDGARLNN